MGSNQVPDFGAFVDVDYLMEVEVVAFEILKHLSFKDLLVCSLVNHSWNNVARAVLHEQRRCATSLILEEGKEEHNIRIINHLQTSEQRFFNHLIIKMSVENNHDCEHDCRNLLRQVESSPLKQTTFRRLSISVGFVHEENCLAFLVIRNICRSVWADKVDHFTLNVKSFRNELETCSAFQDPSTSKFLFRQLKSVEVQFVNSLNKRDVYEVFFKNCPNLQEIVGKVEVSELPFLLSHGKAHLVKSLDLSQARNSDLDVVTKFCQERPRIKILYLDDNYLQAGSKNVWGEIFGFLCTNSKSTLQSIHATLPMLNVLSQVIASSPLTHIENLVVTFKTENFDNYELLSYIPIYQIFPNLNSVKIIASIGQDAARINRIPDEFLKTYLTDQIICSTVEKIELTKNARDVFFDHSVINMMVRIFPNVRTFAYPTITNTEMQSICRILWSVWDSLDTIIISASPSQIVALEPCVLGITDEEWELWKEMKRDGIRLKNLQYAPTRFCLRSRSGVKNFHIRLKSDASYKEYTQGLLDLSHEVEPRVINLASATPL